MMGGRRLVKARRIQQEQRRRVEPVREFSLGVLVGETDTSPTADVSGRPEYVWCSEFNQPQSKFSILNRAVQPVVGLTVKLGYPEKPPFERQVLGVWDQIGTLTDYDPSEGDPFDIVPHRVTHQWPTEADKGTDAVKVFSPALMPLKLEAVSGLNVMIRPLSAYWTGNQYRAFSGGVVDLTPHLPAAGMVRYVLIYLNTAVNGPGVVAGTAVTDDGITPIPLPDLPDNARPSGFIRLTGTQTAVSQVTDVIDARDWLGLGNDGVPYEATQIGQILYSVDGATFEARLPVVSSEGFIITNEDGIIVVADEELPPYVPPPPPPPPFIVTVGARTDNHTTRKFDTGGNMLWEVDHGAQVNGVAIDADGNIITVGERVGTITTRKYDSDGNELWTADHGNTVYGVAVDTDGNIITVGERVGTITTRKYDSDGNELWTTDHGLPVIGVAVDTDGNIITGGAKTGGVTTRKYSAAGALLWSADNETTVRGVTTDGDNNVVTVGDWVGLPTTRKYDPAGTPLWTANHGANVRSVAVDSDGNVITGGARTSNITTRKYSAAGALLWSADNERGVEGVAVDTDNNIITGGDRTFGQPVVRKYDSAGAQIWTIEITGPSGASVQGVATTPW